MKYLLVKKIMLALSWSYFIFLQPANQQIYSGQCTGSASKPDRQCIHWFHPPQVNFSPSRNKIYLESQARSSYIGFISPSMEEVLTNEDTVRTGWLLLAGQLCISVAVGVLVVRRARSELDR
jgi:hypothetical protein